MYADDYVGARRYLHYMYVYIHIHTYKYTLYVLAQMYQEFAYSRSIFLTLVTYTSICVCIA